MIPILIQFPFSPLPFLDSIFFFFSDAALVLLLDTWHDTSMQFSGGHFPSSPPKFLDFNEERRRLLYPMNHFSFLT